MNKLISFNRFFSGKRDTISLFFQYAGDNLIKVNKFYYKSETFILFLKNGFGLDSDINYSNLRVSSFVIDRDKFLNSVNELAQSISHFYPEKAREIVEFINSYRHLEFNNETDEEIESTEEDLLLRLNRIVKGYQFSLTGDNQPHYFNNNLINELDRTIEIVPHTQFPDDVAIPACLPKEYQDVDNPELFEFRVYSVGQANCSALIKYKSVEKSDYDVIAVFDFGLEGLKKNRELENMIRKIDDRTTIVISHFDVDHINNIGRFELKTTCRWLFPEHEPTSQEGNLLYHELIRIASKKSISGTHVFSYKAPFSLSSYLRINQNTGKKKDYRYQSTLINAQCIISSLNINGKNVLIPADALYRDFPDDVFLLQYNYVLIPHHGCRYESPISHSHYSDNISKIVSSNPIGVLLSGRAGAKHGHANTNHLKWYPTVVSFTDSLFFISKAHHDYSYSCTQCLGDYYAIVF